MKLEEWKGNAVESRGEYEYNYEPVCPMCGTFVLVKKYQCNDCGEVLEENIPCACKWNLNNVVIEVCENCGEVVR